MNGLLEVVLHIFSTTSPDQFSIFVGVKCKSVSWDETSVKLFNLPSKWSSGPSLGCSVCYPWRGTLSWCQTRPRWAFGCWGQLWQWIIDELPEVVLENERLLLVGWSRRLISGCCTDVRDTAVRDQMYNTGDASRSLERAVSSAEPHSFIVSSYEWKLFIVSSSKHKFYWKDFKITSWTTI